MGVVSRNDLLRALISRTRNVQPPAGDDGSIRTAILNALEAESWTPMTTLNVTVAAGVVDLWGTITNEQERQGIRLIAENSVGVHFFFYDMVYIEIYTGTVIEVPDETP